MPPSPKVADLLAEKQRLEALLEASDDWRLLQQLEAYDEGGQTDTPLQTDATRARLRLSLADNPFYQQRSRVVVDIDRCRALEASSDNAQAANHLPPAGSAAVAPPTQPWAPDFEAVPPPVRQSFADSEAVDDLTRIRGVDRHLAVALNELGVLRFAQIRDWSAAEVAIVCCALKLGRRISAENWIEQAALLAADLTPARLASDGPGDGAQNQQPDVSPQDEPSILADRDTDQPSRPDAAMVLPSPPLPLVPLAYRAKQVQVGALTTAELMDGDDAAPAWALPAAEHVPRPMTCSAFPVSAAVVPPDLAPAMTGEDVADPFGINFSDDGHVNMICVRAEDWEADDDEDDDPSAVAPAEAANAEPDTTQPVAVRHKPSDANGAETTPVDPPLDVGRPLPAAPSPTPAPPPPPSSPPSALGPAQPASCHQDHAGRTRTPSRPVRAPVRVRPAALGQSSTEASVEIVRRSSEPATAAGDATAVGQTTKPLARFVSRLLKGSR